MIEYTVIHNESQLQNMINGLRKYAHTHPLDKQLVDDVEKIAPHSEKQGPMLRVTGEGHFDLLKSYTIFLSLDGKTPLQVSYYEYPIKDNARACQLTVVDNNGTKLDQSQIDYLVNSFFGSGDYPSFETPPHVAIVFKLESYFDPTVN